MRSISNTRKALLGLAAVFYIVAGGLHFIKTESYMKIMPPFVPWPLAMVYISGVAEVAGGVGLLIPRMRRLAAWGLVALLIAVFPANIYMAVHNVQVTAQPLPAVVVWGRLPLQFVLIWWVLWCTKPTTGR
jgi:uncharacterized membrane protein